MTPSSAAGRRSGGGALDPAPVPDPLSKVSVLHGPFWRPPLIVPAPPDMPALTETLLNVFAISRTSIAPLSLSSASHTAVSSIRFCVVSMALPTSCSVLPSLRSTPPNRRGQRPPRRYNCRPSTQASSWVAVFRASRRLAWASFPRSCGRPRLRANGPLARRSVCAAPAPCAGRPPARWRSQARRR